MKKPKWYAKALYIAFALALAIGLTAPAAFAGTATIAILGPDYAKEGETCTFTALTDPPADAASYVWEVDGVEQIGETAATLVYAFPPGSAWGTHTVEVSATWGTVEQTARHDIEIGEGLIPQQEYNVIGTEAIFAVPDVYEGNVRCWRFEPSVYLGAGWSIMAGGQPICPTAGTPGDNSVTVHGSAWGELVIYADTYAFTTAENVTYPATTLAAIKKWGKIDTTWLTSHGETQIWWNENYKKWEGEANITETVIGRFITDGGMEWTHVAQGADVQWWIMDATAPVYDLPSGVPASELVPAINAMQAANPSRLVGFGACDVKYTATVSGLDGTSTVTLVACGEESVKIVVVAKYPDRLHFDEWPVFPEITSWNFWTQQMEKVPQVRWAGEKIVLEKEFGTSYAGNPVSFKLENQSPGALEGLYLLDWDEAQTVWTTVQSDGVARCMLVCEDQGEVDVDAALWEMNSPDGAPEMNADMGSLINQHGFVVFFLKFEGITLGNVEGVREGHNDGLWTPENPWDTSTDMTAETLNVSEDTLLRAQVKGWFMGDNLSWRDDVVVDLDGNGFAETRLPEGRWVLPDDWPILAGPEWAELRPHWDIMDQPNDDIMSVIDINLDKAEEQGDYITWDRTGPVAVAGALVAAAPVIGPYNSLDNYTPIVNALLGYKTIVQNAKLNWWDAPMPPAKLVFKVTEGPAFFKDLNKGHVYYEWVTLDEAPLVQELVYTNPFYFINIPASAWIPPFVNNGGYDWDTWGWTVDTYGPYPFWDIINQLPNVTPSDPQHPTKVEVYTDNHGEAMVWLNGDWNLDWAQLQIDWGVIGIDIPTGTEVGDTTVKAIADYPYFRKHLYAATNDTAVTKTWTWGKDVRGADIHQYRDGSWDTDTRMVYDVVGTNGTTKVAFIWLTDRDGMPAVGEEVRWMLDETTMAQIYDVPGNLPLGVATISVTNGFLTTTNGVITDSKHGVSYAKSPGAAELALWANRWPGDSCNHAVAAIVVFASQPDGLDLTVLLDEGTQIGTISRSTDIDFGVLEGIMPGDANEDGDVDMGDVTKIERMILGLDETSANADANQDGGVDMGDVTKTEIIILGA